MIDKINEILKGIDKDQCSSDDGWWEKSSGAEFGAKKLKEVQELVKKLTLPDVVDCKHDNEIMRQGDGFVYSTCGDCGDEL